MWFVEKTYEVNGRPKAEDAVMKYAREKYLHALVSEEALEHIQEDLEKYCMKVREENKRLAPVTIRRTRKEIMLSYGSATISIGGQSLSLLRVKKVIE